MLSSAAAHAQPSFELTEPNARAGDVVHFSVSGAEGRVTFDLEVEDKHVLEGAGDGNVVSGAFTMPDLDDAVGTVTVEAEIRDSRKRKKVKRKLEYLGPALPVGGPPAHASPSAAPAVVPQAAPPPEPVYSQPADEVTLPAPAVTPAPSDRPRRSHGRRAIETRQDVARSGERRRRAHRGRDRRHRDAATKSARRKRPAPRTAPLFDGIPEPGAEARRDGDGSPKPNAIAPRTAALDATGARLGDGGVNAALVVPALLGLAALTLAGLAVRQRRRLAYRRARD